MGSKVQAELGNAVGGLLLPECWARVCGKGFPAGDAAISWAQRAWTLTECPGWCPLRNLMSSFPSEEQRAGRENLLSWDGSSTDQKFAQVSGQLCDDPLFLCKEYRTLRWLKMNFGLEAPYTLSGWYHLVISHCVLLCYFGCCCPGTQNPKPSWGIDWESKPPSELWLNVSLPIPILLVKSLFEKLWECLLCIYGSRVI